MQSENEFYNWLCNLSLDKILISLKAAALSSIKFSSASRLKSQDP